MSLNSNKEVRSRQGGGNPNNINLQKEKDKPVGKASVVKLQAQSTVVKNSKVSKRSYQQKELQENLMKKVNKCKNEKSLGPEIFEYIEAVVDIETEAGLFETKVAYSKQEDNARELQGKLNLEGFSDINVVGLTTSKFLLFDKSEK